METKIISPVSSGVNDEFYSKLPHDRIKINWNKNPIPMKLFLQFLVVDVLLIKDHLGSDTGWTRYENKEIKLRIGGGIVNGCEYLDSLQYGKNLSNRYNDYVNPFYLFDILTPTGQAFFVDYYKDEIMKIVVEIKGSISSLSSQLEAKKELLRKVNLESDKMQS